MRKYKIWDIFCIFLNRNKLIEIVNYFNKIDRNLYNKNLFNKIVNISYKLIKE
jgi:hypothetical protein